MAVPYEIIKEEKQEGSKLNLQINVKSENIKNERGQAIKDLGQDIEIKGFRKGNAPEEMVAKEVGEDKIYERCAYRIINDVYLALLESGEYPVIAHPEINVTKMAPDNDLEFTMGLTLSPEIELADYKKIAKETKPEESAEVTDEELSEHIKRIQQHHKQMIQQMEEQKTGQKDSEEKNDEDGSQNDADSKEEESEAKDKKDNSEKDDDNTTEGGEEELPELNDEFVKKLGDFKDVDDFKKRMRESMQIEKNQQAQQKYRTKIIEGIIAETKVDVPEILVENELERMMSQLESDVQKMGLSKEQYLETIKKTEEDIKSDWREDAQKRATMNMILPEIAKKEDIRPDQEDITKQVEEIKENQFKDQEVNEEQLKIYVASVLTNEKVFEYLEKMDDEDSAEKSKSENQE